MPQMGSQFSGQENAPSLGANTSLSGATPAQSGPSLGNYQLYGGGNVGSKLKSGGAVPGKAKVKGNSPKNDTIKARLSPGEGVIDRETMNHPGQVGNAARFVMAYVNNKKKAK